MFWLVGFSGRSIVVDFNEYVSRTSVHIGDVRILKDSLVVSGLCIMLSSLVVLWSDKCHSCSFLVA